MSGRPARLTSPAWRNWRNAFCQPARPDATGRRAAAPAPASVTPAAPPATPDDAPAPPAELADFAVPGWLHAVPVGFGAGLPDVPVGGPRPQATAPGVLLPGGKRRAGRPASHRRRPTCRRCRRRRRCRGGAPFGLPGEDGLRLLLAEPPRAPRQRRPPPARRRIIFWRAIFPGCMPSRRKPSTPASTAGAGCAGRCAGIFPILAERVNGKPPIWLDNAATTHKPQSVIDPISYFTSTKTPISTAPRMSGGARHRCLRGGARQGGALYRRRSVQRNHLCARHRGHQPGGQHLGPAEHWRAMKSWCRSWSTTPNIVPWRLLAQRWGSDPGDIPGGRQRPDPAGRYRKLLNARTKLVAITQVSNALGTITPVENHYRAGACGRARACWWMARSRCRICASMRADADFFVFSGHKVFGPTGIGVVMANGAAGADAPVAGRRQYDCRRHLRARSISPRPMKFEAGTGNIADAVGPGAAIDYVETNGLERIAHYEHDCWALRHPRPAAVPGLRLIGTGATQGQRVPLRAGLPHRGNGAALNREGIAVRSGHHCAQPILRRFGLRPPCAHRWRFITPARK